VRIFSPTSRAWIRQGARVGHLTTGAVYLLVGVLTFAAVIARTPPRSAQGALRQMLAAPLGTLALVGIAIGLIVDGIWQVIRAVTDADLVGRGIRGLVERLGWLLSGFLHVGLALTALRFTFGLHQRGAEAQARSWTALALALPFGRWLVGATALVIIGVALFMLVRAGTGDIDKRLDIGRMTPGARRITSALGRFGLIARAVVYLVIAGFLLRAAIDVSPHDARGLAGAFRAIRDQPYGRPILAAVAVGFMANGALEIIRARYRRIRVS
jgi:hypothetical protein